MGINYDFRWSLLWEDPYGGWLVYALLNTIHLALLSWLFALIIGIVIAIFRVSPVKGLRIIGTSYVEIFRNIPILVQLFFWFFAVPTLLPRDWMIWWNQLPSANYWTAVIALSLYTSTRVAEQIRSGIYAIPKGQYQAALSTGLSYPQMYRYIIVPYAIRVMIPSMTSEFLTIFKNTAFAMVIAVPEVTFTAKRIENWTFQGIEAYTFASLVYVATTFSVIAFMGWVERRLYIPGMIRKE
ncbi:MAG: amino acid ABC transporter permease [Planctomycetota bacterium]|jgi:glutamate/aspartate transport system permease protein